MNIVQLNNFIEKIVSCTETVKSFYTNSVYECWNTEEVKYGSISFCITKTQMRERTMTYDAIIYYGDRLLEDKSNRNAIWSDAAQVIQSIIGTVNGIDGEITISYPYNLTLFEQKFADELAGAYAEISIEVEGIGECGDLLYGYEGNTEDVKLESVVKTFTINGEYDIIPSDGFDAISDVKVIVDVPIQSKSVEFNSNGSYNVTPDSEYVAMDNVEVNVNIPLQDKSVVYNEVGDYQVTPDPGYEALSKVDVKVSLEGKPLIPNGFRFGVGDEGIGDPDLIEWDKYDWSMVYDANSLLYKAIPKDDGWFDRFKRGFNGNLIGMRKMFFNLQWKGVLDFEGLDTSKVVDMNSVFDAALVTEIKNLDTSNVVDMGYIFKSYSGLTIPQLNTSKVVNMEGMFTHCRKLTTVPQMDTSNVRYMQGMFDTCDLLTTIPQMDTSKVIKMNDMFSWCSSLTTIPQMDTSNVVNMSGMFNYCDSLTTVPQMDTSNVRYMHGMFNTCDSLTTIPQMDTSKVVNMSGMFSWCTSLTTIPQMDTSNVTNMGDMFTYCPKLTTIPQMDTSNVTNMGSMFSHCISLTTIPQLDISKVTSMYNMFYDCGKLVEVKFKGKPVSTLSVTNMFSVIKTNGTLYYDSRYDYSKIINVLPSTWTAVPYDVLN